MTSGDQERLTACATKLIVDFWSNPFGSLGHWWMAMDNGDRGEWAGVFGTTAAFLLTLIIWRVSAARDRNDQADREAGQARLITVRPLAQLTESTQAGLRYPDDMVALVMQIYNDSAEPVVGVIPRLAVDDGEGHMKDILPKILNSSAELLFELTRLGPHQSVKVHLGVTRAVAEAHGNEYQWAIDFIDARAVVWRRVGNAQPIRLRVKRGAELTPPGQRRWDRRKKQFVT